MLQGILAALRHRIRTSRSRVDVRRLPPLNARAGALIHPTAVVSPDAELGPDVAIGPFAVVEGQTRIGAGSQIGAHCVIKRFTVDGDGQPGL